MLRMSSKSLPESKIERGEEITAEVRLVEVAVDCADVVLGLLHAITAE